MVPVKTYPKRVSGFVIVNNRKAHMKGVILGVILTLAVLYPAVTKDVFGRFVDTTHQVTTGVIKEAGK